MRIPAAALCGFALDLILGDPGSLAPLHPVVLMGKCIRTLEKLLRSALPATPCGERAAGAILAFVLPAGTFCLCRLILRAADALSPALGFALECIWCWQALAAKDLRDEAMQVFTALNEGTLSDARTAVGRIVGRDTQCLQEDGVIRAAVETVAENFSDGVVAPAFYMLLGGAPLALAYKAVNTLDSMVGYKNERYRYFGTASARLDDAANFLPSRLAALLLIAAAFICGEDGKGALRIWRRDRNRHASPNAAQCEAVMAGALGVRLCGPARYFGEMHEKPFLGDDGRSVDREDIRRACRMELAGSILAMAVLCAFRGAIG